MLVIGDEILSGRTRESNMHFLAIELSKIGIDLKEVRIVRDYKPAIISAVRTLSASFNFVFTSGGIGPTHDDITSECMAEAFNRPIDINEDARNKLEDYYKGIIQYQLHQDFRLKMSMSWQVYQKFFKQWSQVF